jgi:hypothetical protein
VPPAAYIFGNIVNEAPVATREARIETKLLLLIVLMADITPPFLAHAPSEHRKWIEVSAHQTPTEVSNPQHCSWDREMNWCVGTARRVFRSEITEY